MEHDLFGVAVFAIITYVLLATCGRWRESTAGQITVDTEEPLKQATPAPAAWSTALVAILAVLLVSAAPISASWLSLEAESREDSMPLVTQASTSWKPLGSDPYDWSPRFLSPTAEVLRAYGSDAGVVKLYVAYYRASQPDVKLATVNNALFRDPWWPSAEGRVALTVGSQTFRVREIVLSSPHSSLRVWSWYWVGGSVTGNDYLAKLFLARAKLFRSRAGSAAVAIATEDRSDRDVSGLLRDFARHLSLVQGDRIHLN
jgi:EpsI family protein